MKNIAEILSGIGVTIPEDKKTEFDKTFGENYKTVAEAEKLRLARDNYKSQLDTTQTALKEFEGVNVKDLQGKITTLNNDIKTKETEYQSKISEMEFNSVLESAIGSSGAKNAKAVKALLDIDTLKSSKNQTEDIKKAIETVKTDNDYLFGANEPINNPVGKTDGDPSKSLSGVEAAFYAKNPELKN